MHSAAPCSPSRLRFGFDEDVVDVRADGLEIAISTAEGAAVRFTSPDPTIADLLVAMWDRPVAEASIRALANPKLALAVLDRLARGMLIAWHVFDGGARSLSVVSLSPGFRPARTPPPHGRLSLSRFAYLRRHDGHLVIESSEVPARVIVRQGRGDLGVLLASSIDSGHPLADALWRTGLLVPEDAVEDDAQRCWEFHDRLFHCHSRGLFEREPIGGAYRFKDKTAAPPALKPRMEGETVALPLPEAADTGEASPLRAVMESRRSVREPGPEPLTLEQLSAFLHRTARTIAVREAEPQDLLQRPHPGGGAIYELECYVSVHRCAGLDPAIFHYQSETHSLVRIPGTEQAARAMVDRASQAMAGAPRPDAVLAITSRLPRLAWKYSKIAYRVTLLNAGVLLQSMYLTATDMGLAGCANGMGNHRAFHDAVPLNDWDETAVAEFALSGLPTQAGPQA